MRNAPAYRWRRGHVARPRYPLVQGYNFYGLPLPGNARVDQDLGYFITRALFVRLGPHRRMAFGARVAMTACTPVRHTSSSWVGLTVWIYTMHRFF